jgi:2-polyprenyl-6-hydroxyphenyl methylase / 3-demethylubiquinone-9 3-methyltransferase
MTDIPIPPLPPHQPRPAMPRLHGLAEPAKYDRLLETQPDVWWSGEGPFVGLHQLNEARVEYFRRMFGGFQGKRVLDVGCGGGLLAEALAREGAAVTGLDPSEKSLEAARAHAAKAGLRISYVRGTAESLPDGPFDLVMAVDVLEHVADLERAVAEMARVLAAGGGLGFLTHNRTPAAFLSLIWEEEYAAHTMPEGFHDFSRFITPDELETRLRRHGLVVQEIKGVVRADGEGRRELSDDLSGTYLGWALRAQK